MNQKMLNECQFLSDVLCDYYQLPKLIVNFEDVMKEKNLYGYYNQDTYSIVIDPCSYYKLNVDLKVLVYHEFRHHWQYHHPLYNDV